MPTWEEIKEVLWEWTRTQGLRIAVALVVLFVSFRIVNLTARLIQRRSEKRNKVDKTVSRTLNYVVRTLIKVLIGVALVAYVGIDTSGLAALLAAGGVTIGLAVNGALGNIAGGVLIIVTRPFRLDDYIEVAGYSGTVEDIRLVSTRLRTPDNKVVVVPNGTASGAVVVNYSVKDTRRIDLTFPIGYDDDRPKAQKLLLELCKRKKTVLKDPAPTVRVMTNGASAVELIVRVWVRSVDYWPTYFDLIEDGKAALDAAGIKIPYQQIDVHVTEKTAEKKRQTPEKTEKK